MAETEKAILAGGCFWGVQDLIRKLDGVITTRVGYTGGDVPNATYRNHGTHAEAIEIIVRPRADLLPRPARVLLPDPRPDDQEPPGQRRRRELSLGDLLRRRRAAPRRGGHDRRRRRLRAVARQGRDRGRARRTVLGGRARAPGLPRALPQRLHLPLRPSGLEAAAPRRASGALIPTGERQTVARTAVSSDQAPDALGPYSQAIVAGGIVFCSGMAGIDPATGTIPDGIEAQTDQALRNLASVLEAAGRRWTTWSRRRSSTRTSRTSAGSTRCTRGTCPTHRRRGLRLPTSVAPRPARLNRSDRGPSNPFRPARAE